MLEKVFAEVYEKFKLNFYKNIFSGFDEKKYGLSATETFCMEVINALYRPTINDLVEFLELSQPNITYKIMRLEKKGYVKKIRSDTDKREFFLEVTDKFRSYYDMRKEYISTVLNRLAEKISREELANFEKILRLMTNELMPEVTGFIKRKEIKEIKKVDRLKLKTPFHS